MGKYFGIKFLNDSGFEEDIVDDIEGILFRNDDIKLYIHPNSLHLFTPRIGDMVLDQDAMNGVRVELPLQLEACKDSEIIMRGDREFIMPQEEE